MNKRLFIFAAYDAKNQVDDALIYYVQALSGFGDVVLYMDSDTPKSELKKLAQFTIYADATRHSEYDFGSYKRAYCWARDAGILGNYDIIYLVNDSVFGPLMDMTNIFTKMESFDTQAFGLVGNPHHAHPHIQSWFVGLRPDIFTAKWFDEFMMSVKKLPDKGSVTILYEHGLSRLISDNGDAWECVYNIRGRGIYNKVKALFRRGMPFIKKAAFYRHNGALGGQIRYVLQHCDKRAAAAIMSGARDTWGAEYMERLLTRNPIRLLWRAITYVTPKLLTGTI